MKRFLSLIDQLDGYLNVLLASLMILLVIDVFWQVITRFIMNNPSSYTEEIARFILMTLALFGGASAYKRGLHLGIDILTKMLSFHLAVAANILSHLAVIIFAISILIVGGVNLVTLTLQLQQMSAVLSVPMGLIYLSLPISGLFYVLYGIGFICNALLLVSSKKQKIDITYLRN